jgi:hypothetical protein
MRTNTIRVWCAAAVLLLAVACQSRAVPTGAAADANDGIPGAKYANLGIYNPNATTSNWSPYVPIMVSNTGISLQYADNGTAIVSSLVSLVDMASGNQLRTSAEPSRDGLIEVFEIVPENDLENGKAYSLTLTRDPSNPLIKVFWGVEDIEVSSASIRLYAFSKPVLSTAGLSLWSTETHFGVAPSEYYRVREMAAGPPPVVLFDDIEVAACVSPLEKCSPNQPEGFPKLPIGEDGADVEVDNGLMFFMREVYTRPVQKVTVKLPKDVRGIKATFEEGAQGIPMASVVGEYVEYTFFVSDAGVTENGDFRWHF